MPIRNAYGAHRPTGRAALYRALCLVFVLLLTFPSAALGQEYAAPNMRNYHSLSEVGQELSDLYMLRQGDKTYNVMEFNYKGLRFGNNGCSIASVTNAVNAIFQVREKSDGTQLLRDMLFMTSNGQSRTRGCEYSLLSRMAATNGVPAWDMHRCPMLSSLIADFGGNILYFNRELSADSVL